MWPVIAKGLKDCIGEVRNILLFKTDHRSACIATGDFLSYLVTVCHLHQKDFITEKISVSMEDSHVPLQGKLELEQVTESWKSLYGSLCTFECFTTNKISEYLCNMLDGWLKKYTSMFESTNEIESTRKDLHFDSISFYGGDVICVLEKSKSSEFRLDENRTSNTSEVKISSGMNIYLTLAMRFMRFPQTKAGKDQLLVLTTRFYSVWAQCISCLHLKQEILSFVEISSSPLLQWLEMQDGSTNPQFQLVWTATINCLRRSTPPLIFDSAFLKLQSPLLDKTLDHSNPTISEPTINFWNFTYGAQIKLECPQNLLHVLDKLARNGRRNLHKRSPSFLERCDSGLRANTSLEKQRVSATNSKS